MTVISSEVGDVIRDLDLLNRLPGNLRLKINFEIDVPTLILLHWDSLWDWILPDLMSELEKFREIQIRKLGEVAIEAYLPQMGITDPKIMDQIKKALGDKVGRQIAQAVEEMFRARKVIAEKMAHAEIDRAALERARDKIPGYLAQLEALRAMIASNTTPTEEDVVFMISEYNKIAEKLNKDENIRTFYPEFPKYELGLWREAYNPYDFYPTSRRLRDYYIVPAIKKLTELKYIQI